MQRSVTKITSAASLTALAVGLWWLPIAGCGIGVDGTLEPGAETGADEPRGAPGSTVDGATGDDGAASPDTGADAASDGGADADAGCPGVRCGALCVADCNACVGAKYACDGTCVSSCTACKGGADFVVCLVCPGGGAETRVCSDAGPGGCLGGAYAHCPCTQDNQCSEGNQRCSPGGPGSVCTACGEALFSHQDCNTGTCCKSGPSFGACSC